LRIIEDASELRDALAGLPPQQRLAIVLRYWADLREAEIALVLGCPVGTVKSSLSRGLTRLRQAVPDARNIESEEGHQAL
jgi:RNA polymerase sigma factor (sigma-70 family)